MSKYIRVIALAACVFSMSSTHPRSYCQSVFVRDGNITDMLAVKSNDEATNLFYVITRESAPEYEKMGVTVSSYRIIDLDQDGSMELVLTLDYNSTGGTAPIRVIFASDVSSSCQDLPGYTPYGKLDNAIVDLDSDGKMEIITADWMIDYRGASDPVVKWPVIYTLQGKKYIAEEDQFIEYYRNLAADFDGKIRQFDLDNPLMDGDERDIETLKWLLPMYKALRMTNSNREAGLEKAIEWANSSDFEWRKVAIDLLADIGNEETLQILAEMTGDPEYIIRSRAMQRLHRIAGSQFISVYEKLLSDPYYDEMSNSYPLRETAHKYLSSYGVKIVVSDGEYRVIK